MPDIVAAVEAVAEATGKIAEELTQRDAENNAPDIKAAKTAQVIQVHIDQITINVAKGDLDAIRKNDAE